MCIIIIMEILELIQSGGKYTDTEYTEIKKLSSIRDQNIDLYEKFKKIYTMNIYIIDIMKKELNDNNKAIKKFGKMYDENNKLCKHILSSLTNKHKNT